MLSKMLAVLNQEKYSPLTRELVISVYKEAMGLADKMDQQVLLVEEAERLRVADLEEALAAAIEERDNAQLEAKVDYKHEVQDIVCDLVTDCIAEIREGNHTKEEVDAEVESVKVKIREALA